MLDKGVRPTGKGDEMTPRQAIDQAKDRLINSRELNEYLNWHESVRIPVYLPIAPVCDLASDLMDTVVRVVTITIEDGHFGKRLLAEFEGHKEFIA